MMNEFGVSPWVAAIPIVGPGIFAASQLADAPAVMSEAASGRAADIDAINVYIQGTRAVNDKAAKAKDEWVKFYNSIGWYEKTVQAQVTYDKARNLRNAFMLANVVSAQQLADVKDVLQTGVTTEEMEGKVRRSDTSGAYPEKKELLPLWLKAAIGAGIVGGVGLVLYRLPVLLLAGRK